MGRLISSGYESQSASSSTPNYTGEGDAIRYRGTPTFDTATPRGGAACLSCAPSSTAHYMEINPTPTPGVGTYYTRVAFRKDANPSVNSVLLQVRDPAVNIIYNVRVKTDGKLEITDGSSTAIGTTAAAISHNTWTVVETKVLHDTGAKISVRLDGIEVFTDLALTLTGAPIQWLAGHRTATADGMTVLIDDFAVNDTAGSDQNSWCGLGKIIWLDPVADNSVGSNWKRGDGTGGSMYPALDNSPPTGVADGSGTATSQVKNAVATAQDLDIDCESYDEAGVPSSASIVLVQGLLRVGASSTTGTNTGAARLVSNPAEGADFSIDYEGPGANASTDPVGWRTYKGAIQYAPSVTRATRPVMRAKRTTDGSTRSHMVSRMGVLVEYLEATFAVLTGAAAVSGAGTVAGTATRKAVATASVTGVGSVSAAATRKAMAVAQVQGTGGVNATAGVTRYGAAALSGAGTVVAAGFRSQTGAASVAGAGSVSATGTRQRLGAATVSGVGSVGATATRTAVVAASVQGTGGLNATAGVTRYGAAALSGAGSISGTAVRTRPAQAAVAGTGSVSASGDVTTPFGTLYGAADLVGAGSVSATGMRKALGIVALAGSGSVSAGGTRTAPGAAQVQGTGGLNATGTVVHLGAAAISGAGLVSASGVRQRLGAGAVFGSGSVSATGVTTKLGQSAITGAGSLLATGILRHTGAAALSGFGSISASGSRRFDGAAALSGSGSISADGLRRAVAYAAVQGGGSVQAAGVRNVLATGIVSGTGILQAAGLVIGIDWPGSTDVTWQVDAGEDWDGDGDETWDNDDEDFWLVTAGEERW